ncbi:hypothetical protein PLESTB_001084600 [Pleodorina starrii]|uniref:Uncharacterized protein n=1 Tax=Pleodorina starrii TaxID=330485 RepID=A0A9W6F584_9CHLO|nr:hypothetical protein PLESTM_001174100 [Pleodorina starrii]GLC56250.1 hypothetical protein PLESTB_001084600 [Pleodorina starrii]GLC69116.1 hypothetical protein PLESTF_000791600 [Pleodorina starrii]
MASDGNCIAILQTGLNKGRRCSKPAKYGAPGGALIYCGIHKDYACAASTSQTQPARPASSSRPRQSCSEDDTAASSGGAAAPSRPTPARAPPSPGSQGTAPTTDEQELDDLVKAMRIKLSKMNLTSVTVTV